MLYLQYQSKLEPKRGQTPGRPDGRKEKSTAMSPLTSWVDKNDQKVLQKSCFFLASLLKFVLHLSKNTKYIQRIRTKQLKLTLISWQKLRKNIAILDFSLQIAKNITKSVINYSSGDVFFLASSFFTKNPPPGLN